MESREKFELGARNPVSAIQRGGQVFVEGKFTVTVTPPGREGGLIVAREMFPGRNEEAQFACNAGIDY
ncbi:hypothetical protein DPEC_G00356820 [Dallia pectoralis]|uniref:Uncharacterized protein n=1 Tax=Dallia pectoralis TaxID=75939 RepID=A0ACC2EZU4_DALPE|nr:hypothetical protein DPEC_G00356820 [Dallia pectoralis]